MATALGLDADADGEAVAKAAADLAARPAGPPPDPRPPADPDPARWVPRAEFDAVAKRLGSLESTTAAASAEAAVDAATQAGKLTPGSREWALGYARRDPRGFAEFVGVAPTLVTEGEQPQPQPPGERGLSPVELAVCRATGVGDEAYRKEAA